MSASIPDFFGNETLGFVCDPRHVDAQLPGAVNSKFKNFGECLTASGKLPPLWNAPVAAWTLSRLAALSGRRFPFSYAQVCGSDGDNYWLSFIAFAAGGAVRPIGQLDLFGSRNSVQLEVHAVAPYSTEQLRDAFLSTLLAAPAKLRRSSVIVVYTAIEDKDHWRHTPYEIGWDGSHFIFRDAPEHATSPDDYDV